jgi:lysophospholipid acyltransferase (LPLAT)-like uncharacterized protein
MARDAAGAAARRRSQSLKRARTTGLARRWLPRLVAAYISLVWRTTRWRVEGAEHRQEGRDGGALVAAFWHGRVFLSPKLAPDGRHTSAIISNNRDGDIIAEAAERLGVSAIRGSTRHPGKKDKDKGGREAFAGGLAALARGDVLAITPDGPRGPRMRAQPGVAAMAIAAGAPVLPLALSTRRGLLLETWDRFLLPLPFDRGVLLYGPLMHPPAESSDAAIEAFRAAVETALTDLTARADAAMGRAAVTPAEPRG